VLGDPQEYAKRYYAEGADELIYIDIVATLYGRSKLTDIVRRTSEDVFIPMTVGGGIRSIEDVRDMLGAGADKVAINTAAVHRPDLIVEVSRRFGSQCMVLSIEAKQQAEGHWEVYTDCGRERSGLDVVEWARRGEALGAGEILLTSVDREGTRRGFDLQLTHAITSVVDIPVIASGGMGKPSDLVDVVTQGRADAVAMADVLHYGRATIGEVRQVAKSAGIQVRAYESV
jgi:cyclase